MPVRRLLALPVLALLLTAQADRALEPGRWEERFVPSSVALDGTPLGADAIAGMIQTRARCLSPVQASNPIGFLLEKEAGCAAPNVVGGAAHFEAKADCPGDDGITRSIAASGSWNRTSYSLDMAASGPIDARRLDIKATTTGKYAGRCRGDEQQD